MLEIQSQDDSLWARETAAFLKWFLLQALLLKSSTWILYLQMKSLCRYSNTNFVPGLNFTTMLLLFCTKIVHTGQGSRRSPSLLARKRLEKPGLASWWRHRYIKSLQGLFPHQELCLSWLSWTTPPARAEEKKHEWEAHGKWQRKCFLLFSCRASGD